MLIELNNCRFVYTLFRYLEIVRRCQLRYQMEPAGSHGAWSLDDYQFVPFIWGSAQLIGNTISLKYYLRF